MTSAVGKLKVKFVATAKPGKHGDGGGLWLVVRQSGSKSWELRFALNGRPETMGLGSTIDVSLEEARDAARRWRKVAHEGKDPRKERDAIRRAAEQGPTLRKETEDYIKSKRSGWADKYVTSTESKFERFVYPIIVHGRRLEDLSIQEVDAVAVLKVLEPIWETHTTSAQIIRRWIEAILDYAKFHGHRSGDNPARWRGNLSLVLPKPSDVHEIEHFPALAYRKAPAFLARARETNSVGSPALEFAVHEPVRINVIVGAEWKEFNPEEGPDGEVEFPDRIWSIPQKKMKTRKKVRFPNGKYDAPLTEPMIDILKRMWRRRTDDGFVFPGRRPGSHVTSTSVLYLAKKLTGDPITVHGFRAMYRTWADERTNCEMEVKKMALGHTLGSKTEEAYARSDFIEKRRMLQDVWTDFLETGNDIRVDIIGLWIERHNSLPALAAE